jgi:hypothetical protein
LGQFVDLAVIAAERRASQRISVAAASWPRRFSFPKAAAHALLTLRHLVLFRSRRKKADQNKFLRPCD